MDEENVWKRILQYLIKTLNGMAIGLFSTLIIGVIVEQIGTLLNANALIELSDMLKDLMGVGIGAGVAWSLKLKGIPLISGAVAGGIGAFLMFDPVVAYITSIAAIEGTRNILRKETPFDIILIPMLSGVISYSVAYLIGHPVSLFMGGIGEYINTATNYQPFLMGVVIATVMGMLLTSPISSAAIAISIGLSGIAGGAAVVGGSVQMVGLAVMSRKDNNIGGVISIGLGTAMLQFKNILKKPVVWIPPIVVSAVLGPLSTLLFRLESTPVGSGMGTSAFVGQVGVLDAMGYRLPVFMGIALLHVIVPLVFVYLLDKIFRAKGWIVAGDFTL